MRHTAALFIVVTSQTMLQPFSTQLSGIMFALKHRGGPDFFVFVACMDVKSAATATAAPLPLLMMTTSDAQRGGNGRGCRCSSECSRADPGRAASLQIHAYTTRR